MLLWIGWLMLITAVTFLSIGPRGIVDPDEARPITRILLVLLLCGPAFLWPAFRLCQIRPRRIILSVLLDLVVLCFPAQIIIWPQVLLAFWPVPVLASVAVLLTIWAVLVAAVLVFAFSSEALRHPVESPPRVSRAIWMVVVVLLSVFAPLMMLMVPGTTDPASVISESASNRPLLVVSPLTGVYELTADRFWSGSSAKVLVPHWSALRWLAAAAVGLFATACAYCLCTASRDLSQSQPDAPYLNPDKSA